MKDTSILGRFEKIFRAEGKNCSLEQASDSFPLPQLLVDLGQDKQNRPRVLAITFQEQFFQAILESQKLQAESRYVSIQFDMVFPFEMSVQTSREVACVLLFINRLIDLPGFGMSETDNQIYYRYVLLAQEKAIDKPLLLGIVGTIMLAMDLFGELIEHAASGKMTFNQLLEKIIASSESIE